MKKLTLALGVLALCAGMLSCKPSKSKLKAAVAKECIDGGDKQFTDAKMRGYFHEYCECSGEKISEKISMAEWNEFNKSKKEGGDAEIQAKLMPILQPCLDELQKKMMPATK